MNNKFDELTKQMVKSITRRAAPKKLGTCLAGITLAFSLANFGASAAPAFTTYDVPVPGGTTTMLTDINSNGDMVGRYADATGVTHGFLLKNGNFSDITFPGAVFTRALGINRDGDIVGSYSSADGAGHGFLLRRGVFFSIDFPGGINTLPQGINRDGDIVGAYQEWTGSKNQGSPTEHGFLLRAGVFITIDFPKALHGQQTQAWRINENGQIAGRYLGDGDKWHLFSLTDGNFTALDDFQDAARMMPGGLGHLGGLNSYGDIVGMYSDAPPFNNFSKVKDSDSLSGFLLSGGSYTPIAFPNALITLAFGIDDSRTVVGAYENTDGTIHGFLWTP